MEKVKMTDMGNVSLVLGMRITRDREKKTLTISRGECTKSILAGTTDFTIVYKEGGFKLTAFSD